MQQTAGPTRLTFVPLLLMVAVTLAGPVACSTTSGAGGAVTEAAAGVLLPPEQEEKLGEEFSAQVEQELPLLEDPEVRAYVEQLGEACVDAAGDRAAEEIEFEFNVIDKPDVQNAFAGPGGQIYMYTGLLRSADNAAEVGAVMCHEVAHVTERHVAERLVAAYGLQALASAALGQNPGLLAQLATAVAGQGFMLKYSRDMEKEADLVGFQFMTETELDPIGFVTYFERMIGQGPNVPVFLRSHPSPERRAEYLRAALEAYGNPPGDTLGREAHQEIVEQLQAGNHQGQSAR